MMIKTITAAKRQHKEKMRHFYFSYWYKHSDVPVAKTAQRFGISETMLDAIIVQGLREKWYNLTEDFSVYQTKLVI